jgi:hypothetical protein
MGFVSPRSRNGYLRDESLIVCLIEPVKTLVYRARY